MLAGAGAAHLKTAPNEAFEKIFDAFDFIWIVDVNKRSAMKIAVADMTDDRRKDAALLRIAGRFGHAIGKPRDRHADVGRERANAGAQRLVRPINVVTGLPQTTAILGLRCPLERAAAMPFGDFAKTLRLLGDACFRPMKLEEQHRRFDESEFRMIVERAHRQRIGKLDTRDRQSYLSCLDHRVAGRLDARKLAGRRRNRFGNAVKFQRDLGDDAERAFRADEQPRQVVAGG